jgi:hypothetical protein
VRFNETPGWPRWALLLEVKTDLDDGADVPPYCEKQDDGCCAHIENSSGDGHHI